jgi:hypothetical protein
LFVILAAAFSATIRATFAPLQVALFTAERRVFSLVSLFHRSCHFAIATYLFIIKTIRATFAPLQVMSSAV